LNSPGGDGQFASDSSSLADPVALETEEEQLHAVGDYECPAGMSVELESCLRSEHQGIEKAFDCTHLGASCC
jgi:hypothetical protein